MMANAARWRAIYYQNTGLFSSQRYVDNLVNDIAFSFGIGRDDLNIVSCLSINRRHESDILAGCGKQRAYCRPH